MRRRSTYPRHCQSLEIVSTSVVGARAPEPAPRLIALEKFDEFRLSAAGSLAYDIGELVAKLLWGGTPRSSKQGKLRMARVGRYKRYAVSVVQGFLDAQSRAKNDRLSAKNRLF